MMLANPVPVTVLTGFLGSGKTTLINHLLKTNPSERVAIVENEFGSVNIDSGLIGKQSGIEIIELTNGCVCCSVRGELTEALHDLLSRRDEGTLVFDRLILETTGLADPAPVVQTFFVDDVLRERMMLDAVVTLIDCEHAQRQMDENRVAVSQVGFADRLILTKADRVEEQDKAKLLDRLRRINVRAQIHEAAFGELPRDQWIGIAAFNLDSVLTLDPSFLTDVADDGHHTEHSWEDDIESFVFKAGDLDIARIGAFMETAVEEFGNDMLRYKGIFAIAGEPRRLIVQGVHKVVGFDYGLEWQDDEDRRSLLVMIGRKLPVRELREGFKAARADETQGAQ